MTLVTEAWPLFAAIGLVVLITYGALRPYMAKSRKPAPPAKETQNDR